MVAPAGGGYAIHGEEAGLSCLVCILYVAWLLVGGVTVFRPFTLVLGQDSGLGVPCEYDSLFLCLWIIAVVGLLAQALF